jgi:hypothetical protein
MTHRRRAPHLLVMTLAIAGCAGEIGRTEAPGSGAPGVDGTSAGGSPGSRPGPQAPDGQKPGGGPGAPQVAPGAGRPFPARMQRLTAVQYRNTVADLFGASIHVPELEEDAPVAGFDVVGASRISTSARGVELYEAAAQSVARQVLADPMRRSTLGGCEPAAAAAPDDACAGKVLDRIGRRLFRRPLDAAERTRYLAVASEGARATQSFWGGVEFMLTGLLESPLFVYRAERPEAAAGAAARYRGYDMAARLSFGLLDAGPDDALLDAAARGELDRDEGLTKHAQRLLSSPRGQQNLDEFFGHMLHLPNGAAADAVAMRQETLMVIRELATQKAPYTELFTAPFTFVNDTLAKLYGLPDRPGAKMTKVTLPESANRRGLLGHAGVLAESGTDASPILRGKFIRESILCQVVPAPPANVVPELPKPEPSKPQTMRTRLAQHRSDPACSSCHGLMDPIGLALENFDGRGRYRTSDDGLPIDPSGDLDGTRFADARGLGAALAAHPQTPACLVASLHRRLTGQFEEAAQAPTIQRLAEAFVEQRQSVDELVIAILRAETFQDALPPL